MKSLQNRGLGLSFNQLSGEQFHCCELGVLYLRQGTYDPISFIN